MKIYTWELLGHEMDCHALKCRIVARDGDIDVLLLEAQRLNDKSRELLMEVSKANGRWSK